jgi:hypothetical protein
MKLDKEGINKYTELIESDLYNASYYAESSAMYDCVYDLESW